MADDNGNGILKTSTPKVIAEVNSVSGASRFDFSEFEKIVDKAHAEDSLELDNDETPDEETNDEVQDESPEEGEESSEETEEIDSSSEEDETDEEALSDEEEGEDSTDEEEDESEESKEKLPFKVKELSAKVDGKPIKIPNNALLEYTVDGQKRTIHLQEALNKASGVTRIEDLNRKHADFVKGERSKLEGAWGTVRDGQEKLKEAANKVSQVQALISEGKPIDAMAIMAKWSKKDPLEQVQKMMTDAAAWAEHFTKLDDTGRRSFWQTLKAGIAQMDVAEEKAELKKQADAKTRVETEVQLRNYVTMELEKFGMTEEDFNNEVQELQNRSYKFQTETTKDRANEVIDSIHYKRIQAEVKKLDPTRAADKALIDRIFKATFVWEGLTKPERIKEVVRGVLGKEDKGKKRRIAENLSRKANNPNGRPTSEKTSSGAGKKRKPIVTESDWEESVGYRRD